LIGRTQANGKEDFANVHKFQVGIKVTPLSDWGKAYTPPNAGFGRRSPYYWAPLVLVGPR